MTPVRVKGGLLATAFVSSALATTTLSGAPTADATCFSIFGIGNGNGCTSNPTSYAFALGEGATADASTGFFGGAVAVGNNAHATAAWSAFTLANAVGDNTSASAMFSLFSFLGQLGPGTMAVIGGPNLAIGVSNGIGTQATNIIGGFNVVAHSGPGTAAALGGTQLVLGYSGGSTPHSVASTGLGNIAMQLGPGSTQVIGGINLAIGASPWGSGAQTTLAGLLGTVALNILGNGNASAQGLFGGAVNLFGNSSAQMAGIFATALNILGDGNTVSVLPGALLSVAFGLLSNDVTVTAGPGPLSFSGAVFQNGMAVGQALQAAIEDISAPVDGASRAASQTLGDALSAALAGDVNSAISALTSLPGSVLDAFLFGYDVDGLGRVPGLLSVKDPDCTAQCHNGGPIYQFLVGIPSVIATAIANIHAAAENSDGAPSAEAGVDAAGATSATPEPDDASPTTAEGSTDAPDVDSDAGVVTVDDSAAADADADDTDDAADVDDSETDTAADTSDDDEEVTSPADTDTSAPSQSTDGTTSGAEDSTDDGASGSDSGDASDTERAGKHRASSPRHEAK